MSYLDVFDVHLPLYNEPVSIGDIVTAGANQHPRFEVMAVRADKVWVRNTDSGLDSIVATARCRKIA